MEKIIEFQNVSFRYESDTDTPLPPVIEGLNFTVHRGEFVAVLGHNGSGKSTLAKLCNAILLPEEGRVLVSGMDTAEESLKYDIRQTVGMVFQNPDNQIVATIVEEDVAFGPENLGVEPQEIRRRVDDALRAVEMYDFREKEPHRLSGGQKQRVAIAGVIAMRPDCIVLDEPTAMLDPRGRAEVIKTIRRLNREQGITIVLITHFMDEAVRAGRVVVMDDGKILMDGTPHEVFSRVAELKRVGLDVPQAAELADALNRKGWGLPEDILTVEECVDALAAALKQER
ncbi:MAG TPA: energy-coupling factor transporter ATPase [Candidatus Fimivicinus intestinavium]|nr:energy-coupling factor transporter ATPase [Candidatus Fimivicinus intestinavium]